MPTSLAKTTKLFGYRLEGEAVTAAPWARTLHPRGSLAAFAVATTAVLALSACGGPPDRTDAAATAVPATPVGEPGPDTACGGNGEFAFDADDVTSPPSMTGFALPDALEGFDVLCAVSWRLPGDDCGMQSSLAYIDGGAGGERLREIDDTLSAWSTAHGLTQTEIDKADDTRSYGADARSDPRGEGGAVTILLQWDAVSRYEGAIEVQRHADQAGIPLDGADVRVYGQVCLNLQGTETPR